MNGSLKLALVLSCAAIMGAKFTPPAVAEDTAQIMKAAENIGGGLAVHAGCGDGKIAATLGEAGGFLVQGLARSEGKAAQARKLVKSRGLYGRVSVDLWEGERLPYIDNLVNLLLVEENSGLPRAEIMRVLVPQGVAYIGEGGRWERVVKPRPDEMDEWTHYMYDSTGNAVSRDKLIAPPAHLQWVAGPRWGRHHDHMASTSAMVSSGNRVFYIFDEGSTASIILPSRWQLIARDAFNGVVLWKRPIARWWTRFTPLKSGPAQLPRLLVATPEHVYVTLGLREPVSKLSAATGKTLATYPETANAWELALNDGLLYAVTGSPRAEEEKESRDLYAANARAPGNPINKLWKGWDRKLVAIDTGSGKACWQLASKILPGTLAVDDTTLYFHNGESIVAADKTTGKESWTSKPVEAIDIKLGIPTGYMPTLVVNNGVVLFAGGRGYGQHMKGKTLKMVALSAKDGRFLWEAPHYTSGYQSPEDLLVIDKKVLSPFTTWLKPQDPKDNVVEATDLMTGKHVCDYVEDVEDPVWFIHHRCHRSKATEDFLLMSKEGIEFVDMKTKHWTINHWVRGECLYGIMPANGLVYAPMHDCACSADMKLNGLNALAAPRLRVPSGIDVKKSRLTKGSAFGKVAGAAKAKPGDWPTYRNNAARSGVAACASPAALAAGWRTELSGKLTAPVVAAGRLYTASVHDHTLYALDEETGKVAWTFTTGGRVDSPPTIHEGMVLFGSRDGCVYCLRATDGALVWRFRAVSQDRRLMAWDQVESVWPIHGSILIRKGEAWFVAGRSSFLDGGLQMFRLNPATGAVLSHATFDGKGPGGRVLTGSEEKRLVGCPDVLSASDDCIFMRAGVFRLEGDRITRRLLPPNKVIRYPGNKAKQSDMPTEAKVHLFSSYGFLDDSWFHRSYWVYGELCSHRHGYSNTGRRKPAGRILVYDDKNVYGFGRLKKYFSWTTPLEYRLFAEPRKPMPPPPPKKGQKRRRAPAARLIWEANVPILARGLVLAGDTLIAAGPPDVLDETKPNIRAEAPEVRKAMEEQEASLAGKRGGVLVAVSKTDGEVKQRVEIDAPPVFDGLIAANGRLYMTLENGTVQCWKGEND